MSRPFPVSKLLAKGLVVGSLSPKAQERRLLINSHAAEIVTSHPSPDIALDIVISEKMLVPIHVPEEKKRVLVNSFPRLLKLFRRA